MIYLLVILLLKISEDYIANYSINKDQKLVSIYQRKINKHNKIGKGIEDRIKKLRKFSETSS